MQASLLKFALWVVPAPPHLNILQRVIASLATRYGCVKFEPHVTVYAGEVMRIDVLDGILEQLTAGLMPFTLQNCGIKHSEQFFKTIYLELTANEALTRMSQRVREPLEHKLPYELLPHLSLIYKQFTPGLREQVVSELEVPLSEIMFDRVTLITARNSEQGWYDVAGWRDEGSLQLGGA